MHPSPSQPPARYHRLAFIDGLRGFAAFLVLLQHTLEKSPLGTGAHGFFGDFLQNYFSFGRFGIIIFFLISGYLIPLSLTHGERPLTGFAIGRFFRLYPLYWVSVLSAVVLFAVLYGDVTPVGQTFLYLSMFQELFGLPEKLGPYWTLFVEMVFYFLCAGLFIIGSLQKALHIRIFIFLIGIAVLVLSGLSLLAIPSTFALTALYKLSTFATYFLFLYLGYLIRLYHANEVSFRQLGISIAFIVLVMFGYCLSRFINGHFELLLTPIGVFTSSTLAIPLFLVVLRYRLFSSTPTLALGSISYGVYLFHGHALKIYIALWGNPESILMTLFSMAFVASTSIAAGALAYLLVERPGIALGKRVRRLVKA